MNAHVIKFFKSNKNSDASYRNIEIFNFIDTNTITIVKINFKVNNEENFFIPEEKIYQDSLDFCYILKGSIEFTNEDVVLNKEDYFSVQNICSPIGFRVLEDCEILYVSINDSNYKERIEAYNILEECSIKCFEKDAYTYGHNLRVKEHSLGIGKKMGIQSFDLDSLGLAAEYHDIGKIEIDDAILLKEGKLTFEEYEKIKMHTQFGYELTKNFVDQRICIAIKQHHERLDSSGYPDGLKEDEISIMARIIAVADSYDAMTTDRPYRKGFTPQQAIAELKSLAGIHYSADCVSALEKVLKEKNIL